MQSLIGLIAIFALVFMNGFFVAAEFAFVGARRTRIAQLASEGNAGAKSAQKALEHLDSYIAATQLGITLASLGLGWIGEPALAHLFEPLLHEIIPESAAESVSHTVSFALAFSLVTTLHIVLGELAPKSIALQYPEGTSVIVARPATLFRSVFRPVIAIMNGVGNGVVRLIGFEPATGHSQVHSAEELQMLVHSSRQAGILQESEERLLHRVFDFSDIEVDEVMQPRVEVDAFPIDMKLPDMLQQITTLHHSRYPIYRSSIDNVVGVLYAKDLLDILVQRPQLASDRTEDFKLETVLRAPIFVPQTISVDKVLERMRQTKTHLAIVLDEYGGMAGVVTMEDILEELVGEVEDEFDDSTSMPISPDKVNIIDGMTSMTDTAERLGDPGDEWLSTTIGGYFAERLERIPTKGDTLVFGNYRLTVDDMDGMRVSRVRFKRLERPEEKKDDTP